MEWSLQKYISFPEYKYIILDLVTNMYYIDYLFQNHVFIIMEWRKDMNKLCYP